MFGTVSKWIKVYNVWYYGIFMALNGMFKINIKIVRIRHISINKLGDIGISSNLIGSLSLAN